MNNKIVVYAGTRNLYYNMVVSAFSLLQNCAVDKIYFLIEDDIFPYDVPQDKIQVINVSSYKEIYLKDDGPNSNKVWTYMTLLRTIYNRIIPEDIILSLDVDTYVAKDISELWDIDLSNYYYAGVQEQNLTKEKGYPYINCGVMLMNLKKIQEDGIDEKLLNLINTESFTYGEQDAINQECHDKILYLPSDYNACRQTQATYNQKIIHFAGYKYWAYNDLYLRHMPQFKNNKILDIIIPTYNNISGLQKSLQSIPTDIYNYVQITVIDDCSDNTQPLIELAKLYPMVKIKHLTQNGGPGIARQIGIEHTTNPYICFLDTGDIFVKGIFPQILSAIVSNPNINIFSWKFSINGVASTEQSMHLHGRIYRREFLQKHHITFSRLGSYTNEDIGFNRLCQLILTQYYNDENSVLVSPKPIIIYETDNPNSLTHQNGHVFIYTKQNYGLGANAIHVYNTAKKEGVAENLLEDFVSDIMCSEYFYFYRTFEERPEFLEQAWDGAKYYYDNLFYIFAQANKVNTQAVSSRIIKHFKRTSENWRPTLPINIYRFIKDLSSSEKLPEYYLTLKK